MNILGNVKIRGLINMSIAREGPVCWNHGGREFLSSTKFERIQVQMGVIALTVWFLIQFVCLNVS